MSNIVFNKPYLTGKEIGYIQDAVKSGKISGNGKYTKLCQDYFETKYGFRKCLLTTSCTDALEMAAILLDIQYGDEIIIPSYTFVSTANAFVLRGAKIIFADSLPNHPNLDTSKLEGLITPNTKAIVPVHYAGMACDMDAIMKLADKYKLFVVEDAAQAVDSYFNGRPLGSIGHLAAFSFHETKNIISGEGGMLVVNQKKFEERAEIIWEKGTNRTAFWRGEVDKYGWVDIGSSFLPTDLISAFLFAQLENLDDIQEKRKNKWNRYLHYLSVLEAKGIVKLPEIPIFGENNAHMFYLLCNSEKERTNLIAYLNSNGINAVFHYQSLHESPYYIDKYNGHPLPNCKLFSDCLLRLPMYYELTEVEIKYISDKIIEFYL